MTIRPNTCCGVCPEKVSGGYDCTCQGNLRCPKFKEKTKMDQIKELAERFIKDHVGVHDVSMMEVINQFFWSEGVAVDVDRARDILEMVKTANIEVEVSWDD